MNKLCIALMAFCILGFTEITHTRSRSKSSLRHLDSIRIGKSKTIRGYSKIVVDPTSDGQVHITEIDDNKHKITGMDDGIVILQFYDEDGNPEEKVIDIKDRRPEPQVNVGFGFGYNPYYYRRGYYYSSDPFYTPWGGWGRPYYNYYW